MPERVETLRMATGGDAVARMDDGCVVFVRGAVPGEVVDVEVVERRKRFARARIIDVVEAGPDRVPLTCDHASRDCGGCDWLHLGPAAQRRHKTAIVADQLQRLGGIEHPVVDHHPDRAGRRTTVRCLVVDGRAGYRGHRSSEGFVAETCQAAHPLLEQIIVDGRFPGAAEVVARVAPTTGERLVVIAGPDGVPAESVIAGVEVDPDVVVVAADDAESAGVHHDVAGHRFYVSASAFFQTSDAGTETLVAAVADALGGSTGPVVDLYGGVGLLGGAAAADRLATVVERDAQACRDAARNLDARVDVVNERVERWQPTRRYGAVIADPARAGLRADGVAVVAATGAARLVLVSCDPASLGRDVSLLRADGWAVARTTVVDMFPDTSRIEAVTELHR